MTTRKDDFCSEYAKGIKAVSMVPEQKIKDLEARLAVAVEALELCEKNDFLFEGIKVILGDWYNEALAKIKGEK